MSRRADQQNRMTAAAARRAAPDAAPAGRTAIRTKPVRVSLDLDPDLYRQLLQWTVTHGGETGTPRLSLADTLRALVRSLDDAVVTSIALEHLRRG
jgi:hypothetical protein